MYHRTPKGDESEPWPGQLLPTCPFSLCEWSWQRSGVGISIFKCSKPSGSPWLDSASSRMQDRRGSCSAPGGDRGAGPWSRGPPEPHGSEPWEGRQVPRPDSLPCCRYSPVDQIISYDNLLPLLQKHKQTGIREKDFNPSA